jgi:hypothetical protein
MVLKLSLLAVVSSMLICCTTTIKTPYPNDWPQPQFGKSQVCPEINGQFLLEANRSEPSDANVLTRLDGLIFGKFLSNFSEGASAELAVSWLKKTVLLAPPASQPVPNTGYLKLEAKAECIDGWIEIQSQSIHSSEGTTGKIESTSRLKQLDDGSLLVKVRRMRTNRSLLVTTWGDDVESWHIFRSVQ